jgi:divalent metal cation (Fe/Co/Zn/Cd) transporter
LTSAAAFIGISIAVVGGHGYEAADDWAALFACAIILFNGGRVLRVATADVMDAAAPDDLVWKIRSLAQSIAGVTGVEKCLARKSGPGWFVDIHVEVTGSLTVRDGHRIGHQVKDRLLASGIGVIDVLVHVEPAAVDPPPDL